MANIFFLAPYYDSRPRNSALTVHHESAISTARDRLEDVRQLSDPEAKKGQAREIVQALTGIRRQYPPDTHAAKTVDEVLAEAHGEYRQATAEVRNKATTGTLDKPAAEVRRD